MQLACGQMENHCQLTIVAQLEIALDFLVGGLNVCIGCHVQFDYLQQARAICLELFGIIATGKQAASVNFEAVAVELARQ